MPFVIEVYVKRRKKEVPQHTCGIHDFTADVRVAKHGYPGMRIGS
jgi:hypothetical protein